MTLDIQEEELEEIRPNKEVFVNTEEDALDIQFSSYSDSETEDSAIDSSLAFRSDPTPTDSDSDEYVGPTICMFPTMRELEADNTEPVDEFLESSPFDGSSVLNLLSSRSREPQYPSPTASPLSSLLAFVSVYHPRPSSCLSSLASIHRTSSTVDPAPSLQPCSVASLSILSSSLSISSSSIFVLSVSSPSACAPLVSLHWGQGPKYPLGTW